MKNEIKCPHCGNVFAVNESEYIALVEQIKNKEFDKAVTERLNEVKEKALKEAEIVRLNTLSEKDKEITDKNTEIERLKNELNLAHAEAQHKVETATVAKDKTIAELNAKIDATKAKAKADKAQLEAHYKDELKYKDDVIAAYKDFKTKLNVKLLGESLEQHCEIEFDKARMMAFPNASFVKDNNAKGGTKGDYIYREYTADGVEILSIMFDMKNEADATANKHKNKDFFEKLDKDRKDKKCEFAVLVSMLEQDNDYYNAGIVDVSYAYDKMYVVRPQQFIQIIMLLRSMSMRALDYKREIAIMRNQEIDIVNFETKMDDFKNSFFDSVRKAGNNYQKALVEIDNAIEQLKKTKESLILTEKHFNTANNKLAGLSIKKLIKGNKTLTDMYDEAWSGGEVKAMNSEKINN